MRLYQHYKGGLYIVTDHYSIDTHTVLEDGEHFVHYFSATGDSGTQGFVRPWKNFHENVEHEGKTGPRFRVIADPADIMPEGGHP
jgi:hypothetical protein